MNVATRSRAWSPSVLPSVTRPRVFRQAEEMINEIRSAFKEALDRLGWMDESTKQAAKEKVDKRLGHMVRLVGQTEFQFVIETPPNPLHRQTQFMT